MKKLIFTLLSFTAFAAFGQSQYKTCGTTEAEQQYALAHPEIARMAAEYVKQNKEYLRQHPAPNHRTQSTPVYTIPVVFHVLHQWGIENISDAQIYDEMRILNEDFQRLNADTTAVISIFKPIVGDAQIQFKLASLDPSGNCTNGIDRIYTSLTLNANDASKVNIWPRNKYMNVWTVKTMPNNVAGYTYRPASAPSPSVDGIICLHDYVGSIGTGSPNNSRTLTHETGHWLNLSHTWGSTNSPGVACGDDGIFDTPETEGSAVGVCNLNLSVCNPPIIENVQNYMDYSYCNHMYTNDQCTEMQNTLNSFASLGRNNLSTTANLIATGTNGAPAVCIPVASFMNSKKFVCAGGSLTFTDLSMNIIQGATITRLWTFAGGTPGTDTSANPVIQYNTPGIYDVTLTETSSAGSDTRTETGLVIVSSVPGAAVVPFTEDFETINLPTSDWVVDNINGGSQFDVITGVGHNGSNKSLRLYNFSGNFAGVDAIVTPDYNCSNVVSATFNFWVAYAYRNATTLGSLRVYISYNCGASWQPRYTKTDINLATISSTVFSSFIPNSSQWRKDSINLSSSTIGGKSNFRFKFEYTYDQGKCNNLYLDDINLDAITGLDQTNISPSELSVYPNPANHFSTVSLNLLHQTDVRVNVVDVLGKEMYNFDEKNLVPNEYQFDIPCNWSKGVYLVRVFAGEQLITRKLVIE